MPHLRTVSKLIYVITFSLLVMSLAGCQSSFANLSPLPTVTPNPDLVIRGCDLGIRGSGNMTCGVLRVPEDRSSLASKKIGLAIARLPALDNKAHPDAVFLLAGGPGQAATLAYLPVIQQFQPLQQTHDIVLVDQRGTGSSNALNCPKLDEKAFLAKAAPTPEETQQQLEICLKSLPGDPRYYTTQASVQDLEDVRHALGYDQVNLIGVSYGTRLALEYLRAYPTRVRSMVLDSVVPPGWPLGLTSSADAQHSLDLILQRCAAQANCQAAFPNLKGDLQQLMNTAQGSILEVSTPDPSTGSPIQILLTPDRLGSTIQMLSYTPETAALLPLFVHTAAAGDASRLAAQYLILENEMQGSVSEGLYLSVVCAEDVPFYPADLPPASTSYLPDQTAGLRSQCAVWPHARLDQQPGPVSSTVPVLLLSGQADPITPPANAAQVAAELPNSLAVVVPGMGHNVIFRGCLPNLVARFVSAGTTKNLDTGCIQEIQAMPFFTSPNGPAD